MTPSEFFDQVGSLFGYLVSDYGLAVETEEVLGKGDACQVVLASRDCRVHIGRERGDVFVYVRPVSVPDVEFSFGMLAEALEERAAKGSDAQPASPPVTWDLDIRTRLLVELRWYAARLQQLCDRILQLFTDRALAPKLAEMASWRRVEAQRVRDLLRRVSEDSDSDEPRR
jgi:hypothetical protein